MNFRFPKSEKLKSKTKAPIYKFTHAQELAKNLTKFKENTLFLLDYELRGQTETGLDVAEKLANHQNCHLVSNSFQDPKVQRECKRLEVKLFPKSLLGV